MRTARTAILVVAAIIAAIAFAVSVRELAVAFLVAYASAVSVALGVLAITLIAHLTTATWFRPFEPRADAVIGLLPVLAAIGIALLLAIPTLYPWAGIPTPRHAYLNLPFFVVRTIVYWAAWLALGGMVRSTRQLYARGETERANRRFRVLASAGLIVLGLTMTFAAFDWLMSLTPAWKSSIYGVYWFAGGVLAGLALLALLARAGDASVGWPRPSTRDVHALGKLVTTFVLFWLYTGFAQYIVIWSGDLPKEVTWYVPRTHGGWGLVAAVLVFGNFVFPFLLLLLEPIKRSRTALSLVAAALLGLHVVDTAWVVMPGIIDVRWWTVIVLVALVCVTGSVLLFVGSRRRVLSVQ